MKILSGIVSLSFMLLGFGDTPTGDRDQRQAAGPVQEAGSRIAFTRIREDMDRPGDFRLEAEIWMMNSNGSGAVRLTRNTTDDPGSVWSPDGTTIAFYGVQFTADASGQLVAAPPQIFLIDVETRVQKPLVTASGDAVRGRFPSWSPDGRQIAFDTGGPNSAISIVNVDGTGLRQLTPATPGRRIRPDWSPDGRKIAFASGAAENEEIWVMNADGSEPARLTARDSGGRSNGPDWSPDGRSIVFQSDRDSDAQSRRGQIYVMNADGSNQRRLTNHLESDGDPEWSPDGRMIAFQRRGQRGAQQVYVMSAEGGQPTPLTALPSANGHPAWDRSRQKR